MIPNELILHKRSATLEIVYDERKHTLPAAYLRAKSPSAENKVAAAAVYKPNIKLQKVETIGNYALRLYFDDGHQSGIYSWSYLHRLCLAMPTEIPKLQAASVAATSAAAATAETRVLHIRPAASSAAAETKPK